MDVRLSTTTSLHGLKAREINAIIYRSIRELQTWVRREAIKKGVSALNIKLKSSLDKRILAFNRNGGVELKLWLGVNPIGVHAWGDVNQTDSGVYAGGKFYDDAFVNSMNSSIPMVWKGKAGKLSMVTRDINTDIEKILNSLSMTLDDKFNDLLTDKINEILY